MKCVLVGYEGDYIYRMLTPSNKVLAFANVRWINNLPPSVEPKEFDHTCPPLSPSLSSTSKCQQDPLSISGPTFDILPCFTTFKTLSVSPLETVSSTESSLPTGSVLSIEESSPPTISSMAAPLRPVTRKLAQKIRRENLSLQEAPLDSLSLLALLSTANSLEPTEPKSYKEAVSERNPYL